MKYKISILLTVFLLIAGLLFFKKPQKQNQERVIYTTFFPVEDLTKRIVKDKFKVEKIIKGNEETHDFELSLKKIVEISKGDLIIYNGAGLESFIKDLKNSVQNEEKFLDLSKNIDLIKEGDVSNPHTWLSLKNAQVMLQEIYEKVVKLDLKNKEFYKANLEKELDKFKKIDEEFQDEVLKLANSKKYLVTSHKTFDYFARDYGLIPMAISGISPEEEPTAKQLKNISSFLKRKSIKTVFFEGEATPKVAEVLAKENQVRTANLYTMETSSKHDDYLFLMKENMQEILKSMR